MGFRSRKSWSKKSAPVFGGGKSKYNAKKCEIDNIKFDSLAEGRYYEFNIKPRLKSEEITDVVFHPKFDIVINGHKVCKVMLDFQFFDISLQQEIFIDVKGLDNPVSRIKRKLLKAVHNIDVVLA